MLNIPEQVYEEGLLDRDYHSRLVADGSAAIAAAGILPHMLWSKLSDYCSEEEISWVRAIRKQDTRPGLLLMGKSTVSVESRMMAMTGACLRNYIDARLLTVQDVLALLKTDTMVSPTVLMIPNFCLDKGNGGDIATWQVSALLGLLVSRLTKGLRTVLYASSMQAVEMNYGDSFRSHLQTHYFTVKG